MKPYFITMVYSNENIFRAGMRSLRDTENLAELGATHILLDQRYPIGYEKVEQAISEYREATPEAIIWDAGRNLGLHGGLNYIMERLEQVLKPDDIIFAFDADENPLRSGWCEAMLKVFAADPKCGWLSLTKPHIDEALDAAAVPTIQVGGINVRTFEQNLMNLVCGWRVSAIRAAGVFTEPHAYYGGLEIAMQPKFREAGYWVGWLPDYKAEPHHDLADKIYTEYKWFHVGFGQPIFPGSFEEYIHAKGQS